MDSGTMDLARFIFASPEDAEYYESFDGEFLDLDTLPVHQGGAAKSTYETWQYDYDLEVHLANGQRVSVLDITSKTPCCCPHPDHDDHNPSAFVDYLEGRDMHMIFCSKCELVG